jgi:hypothetical protein
MTSAEKVQIPPLWRPSFSVETFCTSASQNTLRGI